jgi:uncharacterized radical SAM superfamily protein
MKKIEIGLVNNRHELPVTSYIFDNIKDITETEKLEKIAYTGIVKAIKEAEYTHIEVIYTDEYGIDEYVTVLDDNIKVIIYVTGLTVALIAVLNVCRKLNYSIELMHYNRETDDYFSQYVSSIKDKL